VTATKNAKRLRKLIEVEETGRFWGEEYKIIPQFVEAKIGNGRLLLGLQPLNTRPNYYVIRVDSKEDLHDQMDDIIDAIIDEYSDIESEREYLIDDGVNPEDADLANFEGDMGWPVFSGDSGCAWFELDWPPTAGGRKERQ
jgi:hypothetical protein